MENRERGEKAEIIFQRADTLLRRSADHLVVRELGPHCVGSSTARGDKMREANLQAQETRGSAVGGV